MQVNRIYLASDHGGWELKEKLQKGLEGDYQVIDLGAESLDPDDDYPPYAFKLAEQVVNDGGAEQGVLGILLCRSGIGMSIAAAKVDGAFPALCHSADLARKAREHNDANILVLDADYEHEDPMAIIDTFIHTDFSGGRHLRRVEQIKRYELEKSEEPLS